MVRRTWSRTTFSGGPKAGCCTERARAHRVSAKLVEAGPPLGFEPLEGSWEWGVYAGGRKGADYYLVYFGVHQPVKVRLPLPEASEYKAEVIDTWNMTITPVEGAFRGKASVPLPGKPYLALRLQRRQ